MPLDVAQVIAEELSLRRPQVEAALALFEGGATLPFIARYRKEATGNLDEVQLKGVEERSAYLGDLLARKETVLGSIREQGKLTPELEAAIEATRSKTELEDLYLPYKPRRRTRASIARERALGPLADLILAQGRGLAPRDQLAAPFVSAEAGVPTADEAFAGARDVVAEVVAEMAPVRAALRQQAQESGAMRSRVAKGKEVEGVKFKDYFTFEEPVARLPSHRTLALRRGEKEGFLQVTLEVDREGAIGILRHLAVRDPGASLARELELALVDAYDRLLQPAVEVEVRLALKERADAEAIQVFAENLRNLLLAAPLGGKRVMAVDPGFRTGCKLALLDETGALVGHDVIYPTQGDHRLAEAEHKLATLAARHHIEAIAVGNGTAGRETEQLLRRLATEGRLGAPPPLVLSVNESGASVYSASDVAREELPDQDVTVRGAVSIGRRLQDPLAELVKIEPKAIGVGQYQHDVHQPTLDKALDGVVESCVNAVGVDVNTASVKLLRYVAGVGETLARNIVAHRSQSGPFRRRGDLKLVPRLGPRAFEQAAGFLRVRPSSAAGAGGEAAHPLDNSAVHPESYDIVERMAADQGVAVAQLVGNAELVARIDPRRYVDERRGEPTLRDILDELKRPGRDPRRAFEAVGFRDDVTAFEHLREGMVLDGVVTNVTRFGAFVDVGVHHDGLVHISELSHRFIKDPSEVAKVGDRVKVKVVQVDAERKRIGLSVKQASEPPRGAPPAPRADASPRRPDGGRPKGGRPDGGKGRDPGPGGPRPGGGGRGGGGPAAGAPSPSAPFNAIRIKTR